MKKRGFSLKSLFGVHKKVQKGVQKGLDVVGDKLDAMAETDFIKHKNLKAKDAMIKPVILKENDDVKTIMSKLKKKDINIAIVVDTKGKFKGEIFEEDLLKFFIPSKKLDEQEVMGTLGLGAGRLYTVHKAKDLARKHTNLVESNDNIGKVVWLLYKEDIRYLPVVDKGKLKGVITISSLLNALE